MPENPSDSSDPNETPKPPSIPDIVGHYTLRIRVIRDCATEHIRVATEAQTEWTKTFLETIRIEGDADEKKFTIWVTQDQLEEIFHRAALPHSEILSQSLLIFGFSTFDAFAGLLLKGLYRENQQLIHKVDEKSVKVSELVTSKSLDEVLSEVMDRDVSSLLRQSYQKVFGVLANRHGISTLKKFSSYPAFIEAAQRRNLVTHCDGVVNSEYIEACTKAGFKLASDVVPGARLKVDSQYLRDVLDILYEVGVKLGHILWRTACPACVEESEKILTQETFELLKREEWGLAGKLGEFAITIPGKKTELQNRIARINYAQALKWSGDDKGARKVIEAVDWTGSIRDLRLGVKILQENFDEAADLMRDIGKKGEIVAKKGYEEWPIFREFRKSAQFKTAFKDVYGTEFAEKTDSGASSPARPELRERIREILAKGELKMPPDRPDDEPEETKPDKPASGDSAQS